MITVVRCFVFSGRDAGGVRVCVLALLFFPFNIALHWVDLLLGGVVGARSRREMSWPRICPCGFVRSGALWRLAFGICGVLWFCCFAE